jgi:exopolyphosphatase/pppGpp-phosphohydrolase
MLGKNELTVSDRGLRHGLLVERFGEPTRLSAQRLNQLTRDRSAW